MTGQLIKSLPLQDLKLFENRLVEDQRGFLARLFCAEALSKMGIQHPIAQVNHTYTKKMGTVRGMHYQLPPYADAKIVTCIKGEVWDVAIDLRNGSPTFLKWHSEKLSESNRRSLLLPAGFAHGFQALTDNVELIYLHSNIYSPNFEAGINPCDEKIAISWPLSIVEISARDLDRPAIDDEFKGVLI